MLQHAAALSDDFEYAIVWWGQSNARPRGTQADGIAAAPETAFGGPGGRGVAMRAPRRREIAGAHAQG